MLYLSGIVITFFLTIILAGKKGKTESDTILMLWLAGTCLHFSLYYVFISGAYIQFPYFLGFEIPLPLIYGPFLFLYARSLTQNHQFNFRSLFHFIPSLAMYCWLIPFYVSTNADKIFVYQNKGLGYETLVAVNRIAIIVSGITYIIITLLMLRRHRRNIEDEFSNTDKINLNWLRYLTYGTAAIWIVIIAGFEDKWIYTTAAFYVFFLGYFGIRQVGIFHNLPRKITTDEVGRVPEKEFAGDTIQDSIPEERISLAEEKTDAPAVAEKIKYQKSSLSEEDAGRIHEQLAVLMNSKSLFRNPELTLADVARQLSVHPNILSQVINTYEKKSFYDYINRQRIDEFKKIVVHPDHRQFTLLALAYESGFNSKTAFNRNFRKYTGLSPREYLSQMHVNLAN